MSVRAKANGVGDGSGSGGYFMEAYRGDVPVPDYMFPSLCNEYSMDEFAFQLERRRVAELVDVKPMGSSSAGRACSLCNIQPGIELLCSAFYDYAVEKV